MSETRSIARSVASNLGGYLVTVIAALIMSPFIVHRLGDTAYGIWALIVSITGYYGLLDFGIRSALLIQITKAWASDDSESLNKAVNTALGVLSVIAVVAVCTTLLIAWKLLDWFDVPEDLRDSGRWAIMIMGLGIAMSVPLDVFQLVPGALQRFDIVTALAAGSRIVLCVLIYFALSRGYGFVGIAVAQTFVSICAWTAGLVISMRMLPKLRLSPRYFDRSSVRGLIGNAMHLFLGRFSSQIIDWSDALIVGAVLKDPRAITRYTFGNNLVPYYSAAVTTIGTSLGAYAVAWQAKGEDDKVRTLLTEGVRWVGAFAAVGAGGLFFVGPDFLRLWIGEEILTGEGYPSSYSVMFILCAAALGRNLMVCVREVLIARGEAKFLSQLGIVEAVSNISLSVILARYFGLIGVAYGALIPAIIVRVFWGPLVVLRRMQVPIPLYLNRLLLGPATILPAMGAAAWGLKRLMPIHGVVQLIVLIGVVALAGVGTALLTAVKKDERQLLFAKVYGARNTG